MVIGVGYRSRKQLRFADRIYDEAAWNQNYAGGRRRAGRKGLILGNNRGGVSATDGVDAPGRCEEQQQDPIAAGPRARTGAAVGSVEIPGSVITNVSRVPLMETSDPSTQAVTPAAAKRLTRALPGPRPPSPGSARRVGR